MKLVMTLLVRDEQDILEANLRYHLRQGVDHFIVTDNRSEDATAEILRAHESAGHLTYISEDGDDYSQSRWVTRMARLATTEHDADWVINNDADEFWWPKEGDLKSTLAAMDPAIGEVPAHRVNFVPRPVSLGPLFDRMVVRETVSLNARGRPLPPKVCHRAHPDVIVSQGNHAVEGVHMARLKGPSPIVIFHFPLRTYAQFSNKIEKGGRAYQRNPQPAIGQTWKLLFGLLEQGKLAEYYAEHEITEEAVTAGFAAGSLIIDTRLRHALDDSGCLGPATQSWRKRSALGAV